MGANLNPILASAFVAIGASLAVEARAATALVDTSIEHQVIRGFGGATVFQPPTATPIQPLSAADLDTLFGNGPDQIGFTLLRIRVAEDDSWRDIELTNALGAKARGASVIATPWSPPAAMKTNNSLIDGSLKPSSYPEYATYLNDFAIYMAANGASLYAISVQNEPDIDVDYESSDWTPAEMLEFCRDHAGTITATRLIAPESFQFRRAMSDPILNNDIATANVDIIGGHIYGGGLADYPLARSKGKEVWMTEHLDLSTDWAGALATAREIHECLAVANFSAYIWWYLKRYYGPLGEDGVITKRGRVMTHFTKFIRPGYVRVDATANPSSGVHVSSFKRDKLVIVAVNQGSSETVQTFSIQSGTVSSITPWITSNSLDMAEQPVITVNGGEFTAALPAESVTTIVGDLLFPAPVIVTPPRSHTIAVGSTLVLGVTISGAFPAYQWSRNGAPIDGATARLLAIENAQPSDTGTYAVTVTNSGGTATSTSAEISVATTEDPGRLINISTRSPAGTADNVQIAGFVISGATPKHVLVRAAGPELSAGFGLPGVLADPMLELYDQATATVIASNDDWAPSLASTFAAVGAFPWTVGSKGAALLMALTPGAYTALVRGADNGTGLALVEVYEVATDTHESSLVNLSTRSLVGLDDEVQIGGFVIGGTTAKTVVIRASGPALNESFGLQGVLTDPVIELNDQTTGAIIAKDDDWDPMLASHFAAVGAFPWNAESKDAAIVTSLDPGAYTVVVRGKNHGEGVALVEIYDRP